MIVSVNSTSRKKKFVASSGKELLLFVFLEGVTHSKSEVVHTNKKHPFLTVEQGFLPVVSVKVGTHVERADGRIGIVTVWKRVVGITMMYNLEVAQDHTFTVGDG